MSDPPDPLRAPRPIDRWRVAGVFAKVLLWFLVGLFWLWIIGSFVYQQTAMDDF